MRAWRRSSRRSTRSPAAAGPTTCSWPPADRPTGPVEAAARLARDRARVVDIGKTPLDLPWNAYYDKELDVRFSRSYGPGRYDDRYELEGIDYPAGYVRWTERRNLECFLDLHRPQGDRGRVARLRRLPAGARDHRLQRPGLGLAEGRRGPARSTPSAPRTASRPRPSQLSSGRPPAAARGTGERSSWRSGSSARATTPRRCCCRTWPGSAPSSWPMSRPPVAVRGQRPAAVRLHDRLDQRRRGARRRVAGRDLHRDPPSHACRPGLPGAGDREGGLRREAARADPRPASADHRRGRRVPATTGSWWASTAASRRCWCR